MLFTSAEPCNKRSHFVQKSRWCYTGVIVNENCQCACIYLTQLSKHGIKLPENNYLSKYEVSVKKIPFKCHREIGRAWHMLFAMLRNQ